MPVEVCGINLPATQALNSLVLHWVAGRRPASFSVLNRTWRFGVKLRHSVLAVSGAPLSSSGLEKGAIEIT